MRPMRHNGRGLMTQSQLRIDVRRNGDGRIELRFYTAAHRRAPQWRWAHRTALLHRRRRERDGDCYLHTRGCRESGAADRGQPSTCARATRGRNTMTELLSRLAGILLASATPVLASPEVTPYVTTASGWNVY